MSRPQQTQVFNTGSKENATYNADANSSFANAQAGIGSYGDALSAFKANNPYVPGGTAETAENQEIADTAAAGSEAAGQALQSQAVRTGQNVGGSIAATENIAENNDRALMGEEAKATENRIAAGTGYGEAVLQGTGAEEGMQASLADEEAKSAQGALGTEEQAAQTPSFIDELGQGLIQSGENFAQGFGYGYGQQVGKGCWVAAEVFGGWYEPRTVKVRGWVFGPMSEHWLGAKIASAYLRHGKRVVSLMKKSRALRWVMTKLCEFALRKASE